MSDTPHLDRLVRLTDAQQVRRATPKHQIEKTVVTKEDKRKSKAKQADDFRTGVWRRDKSRSRASGVKLAKSGVDPKAVGEVHHVLKRSTHPEDVYNVSNGILLSRFEHQLAEAACLERPRQTLPRHRRPGGSW